MSVWLVVAIIFGVIAVCIYLFGLFKTAQAANLLARFFASEREQMRREREEQQKVWRRWGR